MKLEDAVSQLVKREMVTFAERLKTYGDSMLAAGRFSAFGDWNTGRRHAEAGNVVMEALIEQFGGAFLKSAKLYVEHKKEED